MVDIEPDRFLIGYHPDDDYGEDVVAHIADITADAEAERYHAFGNDTTRQFQIRNDQLLCNRGMWPPKGEGLSLDEAAYTFGFDKDGFEGEAPDEICSYCWDAVKEAQAKAENVDEERLGEVGYRLRWKQKGRAREEWYDVIVGPDTLLQEVDALIFHVFTTMRDPTHMRLYGLEDEYERSSLDIIPEEQYEKASSRQYENAADVTIGELTEQNYLLTGDRLSLAYDLGTPSYYYCIIKEELTPVERDELLADADPLAETDSAAITDYKRPE